MSTERTEHPRESSRWRKLSILLVVLLLFVSSAAVLYQVGLWQAQVAIEARQHNTALNWLNGVAWIWPRNAEWYYLSARVNRRLENFDRVNSDLKKAHSLGWPVAELEYEQRLAQAQTRQFQYVANQWPLLFQNAGSDGPEVCEAYIHHALANFRLENASRVLETWKSDFPDDFEPYYVEGKITSVLQRWGEAEELYKTVLESKPDHLGALQGLSEALMEQLRYEDSIPVLQRAIELERSAESLAHLAHSLTQLGKTEEALKVIQESQQEFPDDVRLDAEMGRLLTKLGRQAEAIPYLQAVVEQRPEETETRYVLAQALRATGQSQQAEGHFRLVDQGTKALLELSRLTLHVVDNPADVETRYRVAEITWKWKSRRDGEAWLMSVLEFDPEHAATHALLAKHFELTGNQDKAAYHALRAQEANDS